MSGPSSIPELEVIASTRRRWKEAEKRAILDEAAQKARTVSEVARRHGLTPGLLFRWRRELKMLEKKTTAPVPGFVALALPAPSPTSSNPAASSRRAGEDRIEIVLACGYRLIVGKDVDGAALGRIVDVLERR